MGDSSPAHHTTSSGFSRAESAGGSSDVTAGLGFHRPPSLLNEVSPSFSSSTVEKSVIANPFRGSLPMGCTSATDGQVSGGESENRLQYFSSKLSPTSRTPALRALLGVASELFPVYMVRSNNKERLYGTVSLRSTPLLGSGGDGDKIRGESDSPAVGNSESQREGRYRHCPTGPEREGFYSPYFLVPKRTGEMRPILDLRILNRCVAKWPFRMLTRVDPVRHRRRMLIIPYTLAGDLDYWRNPAVLERGVPLGRVSAMTQVFTDASLTGWGGVCQGQAVGGVWPRSQRHINLLELETVQLVLTHFAPRLRGRDVLIRSDNRATVAYINRQGGVRSPVLHEAATRLWLWAHRHLRSLSAVHVPGRQNVGADLMSRGSSRRRLASEPGDRLLIWERFGEARADLFAARENAQCRLWFSLRAQDGPPWGRTRLRITVGPRVSFTLFPTVMPGTTAGAGKSGSFNGDCSRPGSSGGAMVSGNDSIVGCGAVATSPSRGRSIPGSGNYRARARDIGTSEGLAPERDRLTKRGLSADVIRTIQSARASSTSTLYSNRWSMFVRWCETNTMDPVCCPVEQILSFLQYLLDKRRSASTIKGYAAAISACHEGFGNKTVFSHSLVKRFLTGTRRLRPVARASVPQWDLSTVLNALCAPPFEPLSQISLRLLSLKTALLLALCSTKRESDLCAFSTRPDCLFINGDLSRAMLRPNPAFVPKIITTSYRSRVLELDAFYPPPHRDGAEERWHCLCPVRAVACYVEHTRTLRTSDQMFVCFGTAARGVRCLSNVWLTGFASVLQ
ncbi:hypothetical protein DPEC_G00094600 [Dallia pectoralis]|uniref:Uncharacterized protein n=1 Tax=Dallia pectoralis TaxID=75939 RepID=A0ACC2H110_DALPE|nr:hypothetical protein DPEC_G00094600 [Dallia pectoralis]